MRYALGWDRDGSFSFSLKKCAVLMIFRKWNGKLTLLVKHFMVLLFLRFLWFHLWFGFHVRGGKGEGQEWNSSHGTLLKEMNIES